MSKVRDICPTLFHPNQLGVAMPKGAEIGVHTLRQYINSPHGDDKIVVKVDMKNAFNTTKLVGHSW